MHFILTIPYDGKAIGVFQGDKIRNIEGSIGWTYESGGGSIYQADAERGGITITSGGLFSRKSFSANLVVPVGDEVKPASMSALYCITY